ncbi:unnamed protein product [Moneuplotes crassus]|uniref:Uncharacterized protein n=1 Tax=Euplotes crassus TaxID=5936 RepID=A0AAD1XBP6_EUPCR|nr:unnamed protein product [Moneuplotes crassus]
MISNITNLIQTCMSNMSLSSASEKEVRKEVKHFLDKKQSQIQEISAQIEALKDGELPNEEEIKSQVVNIFTEMRNHEEFKQFCVSNYIKFVSEYLKMSDTDLDCILKLELTQQEKKLVFEQDEWDRDDIDKLLEEIKEKEAILEEMKESIEQFKSKVISSLDPTKFEGLSQISRIFLNKQIGSEKFSNFELDLKQKEDLELVQLLQGYSMPSLIKFVIKRLPEELDILREFIFGCFSSCVNTFGLNKEGEKRKIGDILDILCIIAQNTSSSLYLHNFELNTSDLKRVLELSKDRQKILICEEIQTIAKSSKVLTSLNNRKYLLST